MKKLKNFGKLLRQDVLRVNKLHSLFVNRIKISFEVSGQKHHLRPTRNAANVTAANLRPILVKHADRKSHLMTDDSRVYPGIGKEYAGHSSVNHSAEEVLS